MRSSRGSRLSFSSQRSSLRIADLRPSSAKRCDSRSMSAAMPNCCANRRSSRTAVVGVAYAATTLLYVQANKHTTAASAIFLQSTSPLFILLLAPWLLGEHATRRDIAQMAVMGAGMALFLLGIDRPSATAPNPALGNALAAICAVTWAFTVMGYRWLAGRGLSVAAAAVSGNAAAATLS